MAIKYDGVRIDGNALMGAADRYGRRASKAYGDLLASLTDAQDKIGKSGTIFKGTQAEEQNKKIEERKKIVETGKANEEASVTATKGQGQGWIEFDEQ